MIIVAAVVAAGDDKDLLWLLMYSALIVWHAHRVHILLVVALVYHLSAHIGDLLLGSVREIIRTMLLIHDK